MNKVVFIITVLRQKFYLMGLLTLSYVLTNSLACWQKQSMGVYRCLRSWPFKRFARLRSFRTVPQTLPVPMKTSLAFLLLLCTHTDIVLPLSHTGYSVVSYW